ncbi:MAG: patatin-like phospholipase family protein [Planctomycetaceae bacterium]
MGIAFSGGGIRSATFGLGVLQGLASLGILRCADYLSTVSGGGYIGSWLATWIKRDGSFENVVKQLHPTRRRQSEGSHSTESTDVEPAPIFHLRRYSNYLSPNLSLFAADSWTLGAIYIRNLLANQLCLIPMVFAVLLVVRLVTSMFALPKCDIEISLVTASVIFVALIAAFVLVYRSLSDLATMEKDSANSGNKDARAGTDKNFSAKCSWIMCLLTCASPLLCWLLHQHAVPGNVDRPSLVEIFARACSASASFPESLVSLLKSDLFLLTSLFAILHGLASLVLVIPKATEWWQKYHSANGDSANRQESREPLKALVRTFIASCGSGAVGGAAVLPDSHHVCLATGD